MDKISAGSEIGGASEGSEVESDEIGDIGLSRCQLRVSGCEAEGENFYTVSVFVFWIRGYKVTDLQAS